MFDVLDLNKGIIFNIQSAYELGTTTTTTKYLKDQNHPICENVPRINN